MVIMKHGAPKGPDQDDKREPVVLEVQPTDQSPVLEEIDNRRRRNQGGKAAI